MIAHQWCARPCSLSATYIAATRDALGTSRYHTHITAAPNYPKSSAASWTATDASASSAPWPRSGGCARASLRTAGRPLRACGRCSCRCRSACGGCALFARGERSQHARRGLAQVGLDGGVDRQDRVLVLDEIAEVAILLFADGRFQRQRLLGDLEHLAHLLKRHAELLGQLLGRGLATDLVEQLPARTYDLGDCVHHMHGDADGARLVGNRAASCPWGPPGGIGGELVAAAVVELVDRFHQAHIA